MFKQVKYSLHLLSFSHDLHACVNVLMHIDMFSAMYTSLGTGDILVGMLRSLGTIMVDQRSSRRMFKQLKNSLHLLSFSHDLHACVNGLIHIDMFGGMYTSLETGDILVRMLVSWGKIMVDKRRSRRLFTEVKYSLHLLSFSHDLHACLNVPMHIDMFSAMYTSLGTGDILVGMLRSLGTIMVDQRSSRRMFKQLKNSLHLLSFSHDLHACVNGLIHIDMFGGMYTSLETGDILVRMLVSWGKIMVDKRRSRRMFKQVKYSLHLSSFSHDLHACVNVPMEIDMFSGMNTSLGTADILVRILGSCGKIVVHQRPSRRMLKQVKYSIHLLSFSHDLHACVNVLIHIDMFSGTYSSLGTGDILVRMIESWGKIMAEQRRSRRMFKQVKYSLHLLSFSHDLHACVNVLMHIDMFSGMYTSVGTGHILECMLGNWGKSWLISAGRDACSSK